MTLFGGSVLASFYIYNVEQERSQNTFNKYSINIHEAIYGRLDYYQNVLKSTSAMLMDNRSLTHTEFKNYTNNIGIKENRVDLQIDNDLGFYTHVPSILDSIKEILQSMAKRTNKPNKIYINLVKTEDEKNVELTIFNKSKQVVEFNARSFTQGKLSKVIPLTNGLCEYWIEGGLVNGKRKIINMHNGRSVNELELSELKYGFAHRLRFKK